jgi:alpha-L-fucosidase
VRRLQPNAIIFSDAGPDVRWIGNERGVASDTNWSTVDPAVVPFPGASGDAVTQMLQHGDPNGSVWRPGETDVSIRPGWFYHPAEDGRVRTADDLVGLYFTSVGRNSKLLLNVPPTRDGVLHDVDIARLAGFRTKLDAMFASNHAAHHPMTWRTIDARRAIASIDLGAPARVSVVDLREDVSAGQVIARYALEGEREGAWHPVAGGTTIGYRKLHRVEPVEVRRVRLVIEDAVGVPRPVTIGLYA